MRSFKKVAFSMTILCLFLTTVAGPIRATETYRLSNQLPPKHFMSKTLDVFAEKVHEYSQGDLEVKVFHSAQLFKDTEIVDALQEGLVHMGMVPVNKWSGMIPATSVFGMPFLFSDVSALEQFLQTEASDLLDKEFQKMDTKVVFWMDYGFAQFFNSKRPLKKPADFDGLKLRAFSSASADTIKALGGSPVVMSSSEMYMALQRGTVDGAATGSPAAVSRKLFEVQKYLTECNFSAAEFVVQCNLQWWEELSEENKAVMLKAGKDAEKWVRNQILASEKEALENLEKEGMEIHFLTKAEKEEFVAATAPVKEAFAQESGELGKRLLEIAQNLE